MKTEPENPAENEVIALFRPSSPEQRQSDIATHAQLIETFGAVMQQRDRIKAHLVSCVKRDSDVLARIRKCPAQMRARMAARVALQRAEMQKMPSPVQVLKDEMSFLESEARLIRAQAMKLENRIFSAAPVSPQDAAALLGFVAELTAKGRSFDRKQLAACLKNCAEMSTARSGLDHTIASAVSRR